VSMLTPCSECGSRKPGKLATAYWAWFMVNGERACWKLRYCPECAGKAFSELFKKLRETEFSMEVFACDYCGSSAERDSDPIYLTLYLPGKEPMEVGLQLDGACAAKLRIPITERGKRMLDRSLVGGPPQALAAWDALGLSPN
jgi:hypothetical protein